MRFFLHAAKIAPHPELVEGRTIVMQIGESAHIEKWRRTRCNQHNQEQKGREPIMTRTRLSRYLLQAAGSLALAITVAAGAQAAEVKKLAIMVPEQGTDYGWNQQGV